MASHGIECVSKISKVKYSQQKFNILEEIYKGKNTTQKLGQALSRSLTAIKKTTQALEKRGYILSNSPRVYKYLVIVDTPDIPRYTRKERDIMRSEGIKQPPYPKLSSLLSSKIGYISQGGFEPIEAHWHNKLYDDSNKKSPYLKKHLDARTFYIEWGEIIHDIVNKKNKLIGKYPNDDNDNSRISENDFNRNILEKHIKSKLFKLKRNEKTLDELYETYIEYLITNKKELLKNRYDSLRDWIEAMTQ